MSSLKQPFSDDECLFFLHVPKTAGLSLINILDQYFFEDEICPAHLTMGDLRAVDKPLTDYRFVRGHFGYPISKQMQSPRIITFLRNPVNRFLSGFEMLQDMVKRGEIELPVDISELSLEELLEIPDAYERIANKATKFIGKWFYRTSDLEDPQAVLQLAKQHLDNMAFIGITEHFDDALDLMSYTFDFPPIIDYVSLNISKRRKARAQIPQHILDKIRTINALDIELYEYGLSIFQKNLEQMRSERENATVSESIGLSNIKFDLKDIYPGQGWHYAERHPSYGIVRWTGPETKSRIFLPIDTSCRLNIQIQIVDAVSSNIAESLKLTVGEQEIPVNIYPIQSQDAINRILPLSKGDKRYIVEGVIPAGMKKTWHDKTQLVIEVAETSRTNGDKLQKGICVNQILISPLES